MQLKDVAVLITGGGSGLGAATARAMAAKGARIGVIDQNKENAEKVAAEVKGVALHADVTDEEAIKAAIAKAFFDAPTKDKAAFDRLSDGQKKGFHPATTKDWDSTIELIKFVDRLRKKAS